MTSIKASNTELGLVDFFMILVCLLLLIFTAEDKGVNYQIVSLPADAMLFDIHSDGSWARYDMASNLWRAADPNPDQYFKLRCDEQDVCAKALAQTSRHTENLVLGLPKAFEREINAAFMRACSGKNTCAGVFEIDGDELRFKSAG